MAEKEYYETITKMKMVEIIACDKCGDELIKQCSFCKVELCMKCNPLVFDSTTSFNKGIRICAQCAEKEPFKEFMKLANAYWKASDAYSKALTKLKDMLK